MIDILLADALLINNALLWPGYISTHTNSFNVLFKYLQPHAYYVFIAGEHSPSSGNIFKYMHNTYQHRTNIVTGILMGI